MKVLIACEYSGVSRRAFEALGHEVWSADFEPADDGAFNHYQGRLVNGKERWGNQTDSGQNKLSPSADRWKERSRTYEGIAKAWAEQWGGKVCPST